MKKHNEIHQALSRKGKRREGVREEKEEVNLFKYTVHICRVFTKKSPHTLNVC
jgi:hypothetical protein